MKKILIFLALFSLALAEEENAKVVYDLTTSNVAEFEKNILKGVVAHKEYYAGKFKELDVAVVIHGGAYKFFVKDIKSTKFKSDTNLLQNFSQLKKRIRSMHETYDVSFFMCEIGMRHNDLTPQKIVNFVHIVPNSAIALIDKQNEGFAYLPVRK